jgi:YVTN family beta-propeller protein
MWCIGKNRVRPLLAALGMVVLLAGRGWPQPFAYVTTFGPVIAVIDLATGRQVASIDGGGGESYWIAMSADESLVAASMHDSTGVALIDSTSNTLIATVGGVGTEPEAVAIDSTGSTVYVADEANDTLYAVDAATRNVTGPVVLENCGEPENMRISPDDTALYLACTDGTYVRVATAGFAQATLKSASPNRPSLSDPHGVVLNSTGTRMYYTDGVDSFELDTATGLDTGTAFLGCSLYNGALSPDDSRLYCVEESNNLRVYDVSDGNDVTNLMLGVGSAAGVAPNPDGSAVYVPVSNAGGALIAAVLQVDSTSLEVVDVLGVKSLTATFPRPRDIVIQQGTPATTTSSTMVGCPTTTTSTTTSTTNTTLPPGCPEGATFVSLNCRLERLLAQVRATDLGPLGAGLEKRLAKAKNLKEQAEQKCRDGNAKKSGRGLRKAGSKVGAFAGKVRSLRGRNTIPDDVRNALTMQADPIRDDMKTLQERVSCPADAS